MTRTREHHTRNYIRRACGAAVMPKGWATPVDVQGIASLQRLTDSPINRFAGRPAARYNR
jgi:hypothetical protein